MNYLLAALGILVVLVIISNIGHSYSFDRDWRNREKLKGKSTSATRAWERFSLTAIALVYADLFLIFCVLVYWAFNTVPGYVVVLALLMLLIVAFKIKRR